MTPHRLLLLRYAERGYITLNDQGEAVLTLPEEEAPGLPLRNRIRNVTSEVDKLEYFDLVTVQDGIFKPTIRGNEVIGEADARAF